mgnify:CR=1 FL=1
MREQLKRVRIQEEIKIIQRYKQKEIIEGDGNTRYYHAKVNGRRRINTIISLEEEEGVIEGDDELTKYITNFYKELFGQPEVSTVNINIQEAPGITDEQSKTLIEPFNMQKFMRWFLPWRETKVLDLMACQRNSIKNFGT